MNDKGNDEVKEVLCYNLPDAQHLRACGNLATAVMRRVQIICFEDETSMFESQITPCFQCFYCGETVVFGTTDCPHCENQIDQERAAKEAAVYLVTTKAIQSAGIITNGDISVLLFLLYTFWLGASLRNAFPEAPQAWLWIEGFFALFWSLPVIASLRWFHRYGKLLSPDADYVTAKKDVRWSFRLWIAAHIFHLLLVIVDPWARQ